MGSRIECFWTEPTDMVLRSLRRYNGSRKCQGRLGYCNVELEIGTEVEPLDPRGYLGRGDDAVPHGDPRWPKHCPDCGRPFAEGDDWQHNVDRLFRGAPDGKLYPADKLPPGAMYDAKWWNHPGPDGITLTIMLPNSDGLVADIWHPDTPSKDGRPWTRTGKIPRVTCTPSIQTSSYHGFLTDGYLVEC